MVNDFNIMNRDNYINLLKLFLDNDYKFCFFDEFVRNNYSSRIVILRHDIDFSVKKAYEIALLESDLRVYSTYFFLISQEIYNPFSFENAKLIKKIQLLGHKISIHFDPTVYDDPKEGFIREKNIFETFFETKIDVISIHKPSKDFLEIDLNEWGIINTYSKDFFNGNLIYISDSNHNFNYGDLRNHVLQGRGIQLLIHPIWWATMEMNPIVKLHYINGEKFSEILKYTYKTVGRYKSWLQTE